MRWERPTGVVMGFAAGMLGGLSTVHGPLLIVYAASLRLAKEAFIATLGTFFLIGGICILVTFVERGILTREMAPWSLLCVLPALAGMWLGRRLGHRIDQERFRTAVPIVLFVLGANLMRRAIS